MSEKLKSRIDRLTDIGAEYIESMRIFTKGNVRIDVDVVEYGTDELFEKHFKKIER